MVRLLSSLIRSTKPFTSCAYLSRRLVSTKIFVNSISWKTDEADLREAFSRYGDVEEVKIGKIQAGSTTGIVSFRTFDQAKAAIIQMNGQELNGRLVDVDFAPLNEEFSGADSDEDDEDLDHWTSSKRINPRDE